MHVLWRKMASLPFRETEPGWGVGQQERYEIQWRQMQSPASGKEEALAAIPGHVAWQGCISSGSSMGQQLPQGQGAGAEGDPGGVVPQDWWQGSLIAPDTARGELGPRHSQGSSQEQKELGAETGLDTGTAAVWLTAQDWAEMGSWAGALSGPRAGWAGQLSSGCAHCADTPVLTRPGGPGGHEVDIGQLCASQQRLYE